MSATVLAVVSIFRLTAKRHRPEMLSGLAHR
jgi:hypothetical protein